jgi:hypothetical protein
MAFIEQHLGYLPSDSFTTTVRMNRYVGQIGIKEAIRNNPARAHQPIPIPRSNNEI